jgi:hypothetical protein
VNIRRQIRVLHRWIGLAASLWILQLAFTGLLLQQSNNLSLHERYVESATVLQWFGYGRYSQSFEQDNAILYQVDNQVLAHSMPQRIPHPIRLAAHKNGLWVMVAAQGIYALNNKDEIIWRLDEFDGVPTPITNLHVADDIWIQQHKQWYTIDSQLQIKKSKAPAMPLNKAVKREMTATERRRILPQALANVLSYDKVLADIHAGYKGSAWLNTVSALALLYLSLSGIYLFFKPRKKDRKTRH